MVSGFGVEGLGFMVLGFDVLGLGLWAQGWGGAGSRIQDPRVQNTDPREEPLGAQPWVC